MYISKSWPRNGNHKSRNFNPNWRLFGGVFDPESQQKRIAEIEKQSSDPDFWNDSENAKALTKELDQAKSDLQLCESHKTLVEDAEVLGELAEESGEDSVWSEAEAKLEEAKKALEAVEFRLMLSEPEDRMGAILTINAGAGGTESCDWAEMLNRMYLRYCERQGFKATEIDQTPGEEAGIKSITLSIDGDYAYGYLKAENGVHRLVRISPFDTNKRRHTSFASVFLSPQVSDEIAIEVDSGDLRIDTFRAGGKGGQNVQKNDTAVRLTHIPTGTVVQCQSERSQHRNKDLAMKVLKSRLYEKELEKRRAEKEAVEATKKKIEWGSQIRSYVLHPYKMVKDHRTGMEVGNAEGVLDGDLEGLIQAYLLHG